MPEVQKADDELDETPNFEPEAENKISSDFGDHGAWSQKMLPLMSRMVFGLTVFFFVASIVQLAYLHYEITNAPQPDFNAPIQMLETAQGDGQVSGASTANSLPAATIAVLTALERSAIERRYHQANVSLLSRTWTRYLGFVTGMVLAMVGAVFILGRLETSVSTASAKVGGGEFDFRSSSPGLILVGLGVVLMITTIVIHHEIQVQDQSIYARGWSLGGSANSAAAPNPFSKPEPDVADANGNPVAANPSLETLLDEIGKSDAGVSAKPPEGVEE